MSFAKCAVTLLLLASMVNRGWGQAGETGWKPALAPLMTRWAKQVTPSSARPEYPRPQAVRKNWLSLNGLWDFAFDDENQGLQKGWTTGAPLPGKILVPFTFEAALSGIGKGSEIHERVWYRRLFTVPKAWKGQHVLLHFGAVDWEATVWLNGQEVVSHRGGYAPFSADVTSALNGEGAQELVVAVYDPSDPAKNGWQPKGKQLGSHEIWYTRTTGIWQSVWLEPVAETYIRTLALRPNASTGELVVEVETDRDKAQELLVRVAQNGKEVATFRHPVAGLITVTGRVPKPKLWSPEQPALYDVTLTLKRNGKTLDEIQSYCAFRSVGIQDGRITLNGKPYFLRGVLDQGFWPDGIYTAPTDEAIRNEVVITRAMGLNLARKHVKVEDPRWYYWCDKLGLLVAQDMPSSHNLSRAAAQIAFVMEWKEILKTLHSHPCIVLWIPFNENWGDPKAFQDKIVRLTRMTDSTRPIIDASGWTQHELTDIIDIHEYGNDLKKHVVARPPKPRWIGEYGGVALPVEGHTWTKGWGYQSVKTPAQLVEKYRFLTAQINNAPGLSGFCYTQLTDVEQEMNGLLTYDRLPKAPPEQFAAINNPARLQSTKKPVLPGIQNKR